MLWKKRTATVLASLLVIHVLAHIDRNMLLGFSPQIIADLKISNHPEPPLAFPASDMNALRAERLKCLRNAARHRRSASNR